MPNDVSSLPVQFNSLGDFFIVSEFVKQLTDSIADQAIELAELKQALAALTAKLNPPPLPKPKVDSRPEKVVESHEDYLVRKRQEAIAHQELEKSFMAKRREGLSDGQWRDDCGIIRDRDGKVVPTGRALEQQLAKAAAHDKAARAEDIAWRKAVDLPILHGADDDDE